MVTAAPEIITSPDRALIPLPLMARYEAVRKPPEKTGEGKLTLPHEMEKRLDNIASIIDATRSTITLDAEAQIDDLKRALNIEVDSKSVTLKFGKAARIRQKEYDRQIAELRETYEEGVERWRDIIARAEQGDMEALEKLVGGIWGVQYFEHFRQGSMGEDPRWKKHLLGDDPFGEWFITKIAHSALGRHNILGGADSLSFTLFQNLLPTHKDWFKDPKTVADALRRNVKRAWKWGRGAPSPKGYFWHDFSRQYARELLLDLEREATSSISARVLGEASAIMVSAALEDRDMARLIYESAKQIGLSEAIIYEESQGTISFRTTEGIVYPFHLLSQLLETSGKTAHADLEISVAPEIKRKPPEVNPLVSKSKILEQVKVTGIVVPSMLKANLALQLEKGFVYRIFHGPRGTGKTSCGVAAYELLNRRVKQETGGELPFLGPRTETPEAALEAIREAIWRWAEGKPTFLIIDEMHRVFDGKITEEQVIELLHLERIINEWAQTDLMPIGGIVLAGEKSLDEIAIAGTDRTIGMTAAGEPHRIPADEIVLWEGDREKDKQWLSKLIKAHPRLAKLSREKLQPFIDKFLDRIVAAVVEERRYITPSFIFYHLETAHARLARSEPAEEIIADLDREITRKISTGIGETLRSIQQVVEKKFQVVETALQELEEARRLADAKDAMQEARLDNMEQKLADLLGEVRRFQERVEDSLERLMRRPVAGATSILDRRLGVSDAASETSEKDASKAGSTGDFDEMFR